MLNFLIWNEKRKMVGNWLKKRAGGKHDKPLVACANKGTFPKTLVHYRHGDHTGQDNYELSYFYTPDDSKPRALSSTSRKGALQREMHFGQLADGQVVLPGTERGC